MHWARLVAFGDNDRFDKVADRELSLSIIVWNCVIGVGCGVERRGCGPGFRNHDGLL